MAKVKIDRNKFVTFYPAESWPPFYEVETTDEEERWILQTWAEWKAVQKFIAGKIAQMEQEKDGK